MKILRGTLFGGIAFFFLGWLVWGILLMDYSKANYNQSIYLPEDGMIWWAMIASNLVLALLVTLAMNWARAKTIVDGLKFGAIVGGLYALTTDLGMYSMTNVISNLGAVVVDTLAYAVVTAIVGMVIVLTWGRGKTA